MKSWSMTMAPALVPHPIDSRRYDLLLEQVAQALYKYFASSKKMRGQSAPQGSSTGNQPKAPKGAERKGS